MFFVLLKSPTLGIVGVIVAKINVLPNSNNFLVEKPNKIDIYEKILFKEEVVVYLKLELADFLFDHCPISAIAVPSFKR